MKSDFSGDPEADPGGRGKGIALDVVDEEREDREVVCASEVRVGFVASSIESLQRLGEGVRVGQGCHSWLSSRLETAALSDSAQSRFVTSSYSPGVGGRPFERAFAVFMRRRK